MHRILVCIDHSNIADAGVSSAIWLARALGSELTLVHVMQPRHEHAGLHSDALGWEINRQEARAFLERHERTAVAALRRTVEIRLEQGRPAERITELAREVRADLTIVSSHDGSDANAWSLGTTAQQVIAASRGSVFVARGELGAANATTAHVIVPLDGSQRAESVLPIATQIARASSAEIVLVHVVATPIPSGVLHAAEDLELATTLAAHLEARAAAYLETRAQLIAPLATVRTVVLAHANPRSALLELSKREHASLIVVAAHGAACDPARRFGSVTEYLLAHSGVPLLVLQDLGDGESHRADRLAIGPPHRTSFAQEPM